MQHPGIGLSSLSIFHLDLFINNELQRQQKVMRYSQSSMRDGMPHYYLPNAQNLEIQEWDYNEIIPSVQKLLEALPMKCKVCEAESNKFPQATVLGKYNVDYFQCSNCGFVQTEEPYWLEEAYSEAIAATDVGLVLRNNALSQIAANLIFNLFNHEAKFLDYGGGYGLFVRLMRDLGFDFYWYDKFCKNLFAKGFESNEAADSENYELVTAFEVFEHFVNPIAEIENILKFSSNIILTTDLLPETNPKPNEWWYYAPHEGQHISIYTLKSLSIIAEKYELNLYSNGKSLHLITEKNISHDVFYQLCQTPIQRINKVSLLESDYLQAIKSFNSGNSYLNFEYQSRDNTDVIQESKLQIIVDGVFFQLYQTGIARVWKSLLTAWVRNGFGKHIILLDRGGFAPKIPGIRYREIPLYKYSDTDADREMLQQVCDEEGADVFISTYYTTPLTTPSVFMAHDMIPELMGWDLNHPMWREKHYGIEHASAYIAVSENTARDLVKVFTNIPLESIIVAHNGIDHQTFSPAGQADINLFKTKYGIAKPYFILVGAGDGYKNGILFFQAFAQLASKQGFDIVITGSGGVLAPEYREYSSGSIVHMLQLSDEELVAAYSGAVALVYPSKYEGFGLPVLEAMACGCPVITCPNGPIPEVAGEAAIYVNDEDVEGLTNALCEVQKPSVRNTLIAAGLAQAKKFSWSKMAGEISSALVNTSLLRLNLKEINLIIFPDWSQSEEDISVDLIGAIKAIAIHPSSQYMTLLIDTSNISVEDAELLLSGVTMHLLMAEDVDVSEGLEISLLGNIDDIQWQALLPRINARIILEQENTQAVQLLADQLTSYEIDDFSAGKTEQFFFT